MITLQASKCLAFGTVCSGNPPSPDIFKFSNNKIREFQQAKGPDGNWYTFMKVDKACRDSTIEENIKSFNSDLVNKKKSGIHTDKEPIVFVITADNVSGKNIITWGQNDKNKETFIQKIKDFNGSVSYAQENASITESVVDVVEVKEDEAPTAEEPKRSEHVHKRSKVISADDNGSSGGIPGVTTASEPKSGASLEGGTGSKDEVDLGLSGLDIRGENEDGDNKKKDKLIADLTRSLKDMDEGYRSSIAKKDNEIKELRIENIEKTTSITKLSIEKEDLEANVKEKSNFIQIQQSEIQKLSLKTTENCILKNESQKREKQDADTIQRYAKEGKEMTQEIKTKTEENKTLQAEVKELKAKIECLEYDLKNTNESFIMMGAQKTMNEQKATIKTHEATIERLKHEQMGAQKTADEQATIIRTQEETIKQQAGTIEHLKDKLVIKEKTINEMTPIVEMRGTGPTVVSHNDTKTNAKEVDTARTQQTIENQAATIKTLTETNKRLTRGLDGAAVRNSELSDTVENLETQLKIAISSSVRTSTDAQITQQMSGLAVTGDSELDKFKSVFSKFVDQFTYCDDIKPPKESPNDPLYGAEIEKRIKTKELEASVEVIKARVKAIVSENSSSQMLPIVLTELQTAVEARNKNYRLETKSLTPLVIRYYEKTMEDLMNCNHIQEMHINNMLEELAGALPQKYGPCNEKCGSYCVHKRSNESFRLCKCTPRIVRETRDSVKKMIQRCELQKKTAYDGYKNGTAPLFTTADAQLFKYICINCPLNSHQQAFRTYLQAMDWSGITLPDIVGVLIEHIVVLRHKVNSKLGSKQVFTEHYTQFCADATPTEHMRTCSESELIMDYAKVLAANAALRERLAALSSHGDGAQAAEGPVCE